MSEPWEQVGYCDCGRTWNTYGEAHCPGCHEHFTSDSGFDAHRRDGQCHDPATLRGVKTNRIIFASTGRASGQAWKLASDKPHYLSSKARGEQQEPSELLETA